MTQRLRRHVSPARSDWAVQTASSPEEAKSYPEGVGHPVVLEIISTDILHKTDVGRVLVGLSSIEAVEASYLQIMENAVTENPQIAQTEMSPVMVHEHGASAADARIVLTG